MKLLACVGVAVTCLLSSQAFAQAKNFEGFSVGLGVSNVHARNNVSVFNSNTSDFSSDAIAPTLEFGYTHALNEQFSLGVNVTYDLGNTKLTSWGTDCGSSGCNSEAYIKSKNHYSVNIQPGYAIRKNVLVYGILGLHQIRISQSFSDSFLNDSAYSKTFTGYGYGLGAQIAINKSLYVKAEVQQVNYQQKNSSNVDGDDLKPLTTLGIVGVGYRF